MYKSKKIAVFYHLYQINNWREILTAQYARMQSADLVKHMDYFYIGVNTDNFSPLPDMKVNNIVVNHYKESEADTLRALWEFCQIHADYNILYFHSKGVSHSYCHDLVWTKPANMYIDNWKEYLEYFVIDRWRACLLQLETHDCAGTEWPTPYVLELNNLTNYHYCGNFWWASSNYICQLDPDFIYHSRHNCEFWIGTNTPNAYNFWFSNRDLYYFPLEPEEYKNILLDEL